MTARYTAQDPRFQLARCDGCHHSDLDYPNHRCVGFLTITGGRARGVLVCQCKCGTALRRAS